VTNMCMAKAFWVLTHNQCCKVTRRSMSLNATSAVVEDQTC
jgi:hypothetical protein